MNIVPLHRGRRWALALAAAVFLAMGAAPPARSASVLPLYLEEMIDTSALAFEGRCTANRSERDPATNLVVTYTTFEVRDVLKGSAGTTHVIKQVGGSLPGDALQFRVEGIPEFTVGEDYVVLLAGVSRAGFSSPVGLAQGSFRVKGGPTNREVGNGRDFRDMTSRIAARLPAQAIARMEQRPGPAREMDLQDFKQTVRNHVRGAR